METNKDITTFDEHLITRYGETGTAKRTEFEIKAKAFLIVEVIKSKLYRLLELGLERKTELMVH